MIFDTNQGFCHRVNGDILQSTGALKIRLDGSVENWPKEVLLEIQKNPCCHIRWWINVRNKIGIFGRYFKTYHVILCYSCVRPFHTQPNLVGSKRWFADIYDRENGRSAIKNLITMFVNDIMCFYSLSCHFQKKTVHVMTGVAYDADAKNKLNFETTNICSQGHSGV